MRTAVLAIGCIIGAIVVGVLAVDLWLLREDEVATLWTSAPGGPRYETQVWVLDEASLDGEGLDVVWLRAHSPDAEWLARLRENPQVELQRGGRSVPYRASVPAEAARLRPTLNAAMARKYGLADALVGWLLPADRAVPVRLDPDPSRQERDAGGGAHGAPEP